MGSAGTAQREEQEEDVVVLDCRNGYESDVGKFQGAVPLNTNTFRSPHPPQPSNPQFPHARPSIEKGSHTPFPSSAPTPGRACMHAYVRACVWSRDTWEALERELGARDRSKTQVLIYCTGGIRCVKVSISLLSPSSPLPSPSLPFPFLSLPFPLLPPSLSPCQPLGNVQRHRHVRPRHGNTVCPSLHYRLLTLCPAAY